MKTLAVVVAIHLIIGVVVYVNVMRPEKKEAQPITVATHAPSPDPESSSIATTPKLSAPPIEGADRLTVALPADESAKLKAIYDSASDRRAAVDRAIDGSSAPTRVNNNSESPKLEAILRKAGWDSPTVTEGVKLSTPEGFTFRLEVIDGSAQDWYVAIETDRSISSGRVVTKSRHSPW